MHCRRRRDLPTHFRKSNYIIYPGEEPWQVIEGKYELRPVPFTTRDEVDAYGDHRYNYSIAASVVLRHWPWAEGTFRKRRSKVAMHDEAGWVGFDHFAKAFMDECYNRGLPIDDFRLQNP